MSRERVLVIALAVVVWVLFALSMDGFVLIGAIAATCLVFRKEEVIQRLFHYDGY